MIRVRTSGRFAAAIAVTAALALSACSGSSTTEESAADDAAMTAETPAASAAAAEDTTAESKPELETTSVSIGLGLDPGLAPQMVAIDKGFLTDEGFTDVTSSTYAAGALAGEALAAGEIDLWGPGNLPPINMRHNGVPIVVVGTAASGWSEKLIVREDANIQTPEDLTKIKIGSLTGATSNIINNLAKANGLDPADIQTVNLTPPEQMVALANNEVQGLVIWNPWPAQFEKDHPDIPIQYLWENNVSYFPWADGEEMKASNSRMVFVLKEDFVKDNPNSSEALMSAMFKAQQWLADPANRDEAIAIFAKYTEYPTDVIEKIWDDYVFEPNLDAAYLTDMQAYTDFLAGVGAIKDPQDPASYTYPAFVAEVDPSAADIEGAWQP